MIAQPPGPLSSPSKLVLIRDGLRIRDLSIRMHAKAKLSIEYSRSKGRDVLTEGSFSLLLILVPR